MLISSSTRHFMLISAVNIRSATPSDAQRIHELHVASVRALCRPQYAQKIVEGWLADRSADGYLPRIASRAIVVAESESRVVGFGEGVPGEVVAVFVDPAFVQRGIGSTLLDHALRLARKNHGGPVRLEATLNAVGFYARFGFHQVGNAVALRNHVEVPIVLMENDG